MKIKGIIALTLACAIAFSGCGANRVQSVETAPETIVSAETVSEAIVDDESIGVSVEETLEQDVLNDDLLSSSDREELVEYIEGQNYSGLDDPAYLQYVEDSIYAELESELGSDDYQVESVQAVYLSQEYIDELTYNSQSNVFFGYTLAELDEQFDGTRYVFTMDDDGQTDVQPFEEYEYDYSGMIRNVAIGGGVITVLVIVSVATAGTGTAPAIALIHSIALPAVHMAANMAISGTIIGGISAGLIEGLETHNFGRSTRVAAEAASAGFRNGAIIGAATGALSALPSAVSQYLDTVGRTVRLETGPFRVFYDRSIGRIHTWREAEGYANTIIQGREQVSFLNGVEVSGHPLGSTRPDIVTGNMAWDVKLFDLAAPGRLAQLARILEEELPNRIANMPSTYGQGIILDVYGRGWSEQFINEAVNYLRTRLVAVCPDLEIMIVGMA